MEKAGIFMDGEYFNKILRDYFKTPNIKYDKLCEIICEKLKVDKLRTYYYHCLPMVRRGNKEDTKKHYNMQRFLRGLNRLPRFEVRLGKIQLIAGKFRQKMIDVLMSLDIVNSAFEKQVQHIVLVAGDADFIPAIRKAKNYGAIIHLYYHPSSVHDELLDEIDELHIIDKGLIEGCLR